MVSFVRLLAYSLVFAAATTSPASAQTTCRAAPPEMSVYDLVSTNDKSNPLGTAFLIDTERGLFLTAYHNLMYSPLLLKSGNTEYEFDYVASGQNPSITEINDWVILRAKVADPSKGVYPNLDLPVAYDLPNMSSLAKALVLSRNGEISNLNAVSWNPDIGPKEVCETGQMALIEIANYDRGNSGAAVYSGADCAAVAIASRFELAENIPDPTRKEMVKLFTSYTHLVTQAGAQQLRDEKRPLTERYNVLREMLKNKMLVKIVPAQCVIDRLILDSIENKEKIEILSESQTTKLLSDTLIGMNADNYKISLSMVQQIADHRWKWIDYLQVVNDYRRSIHTGATKAGDYSYLVDNALEDVGKKLRFQHIARIYDGAGYRLASVADGNDSGVAVASEFKSTFLQENADWRPEDKSHSPDASFYNYGLKIPPGVAENLTPKAKVLAGLEIAKSLTAQVGADAYIEDAQTRKIVSDTAVAYLASGLQTSSSDEAPTTEERGQALVMIAKLISDGLDTGDLDIYRPVYGPSLVAQNVKTAQFSDRLSNIAEWQLAEHDPLRATVAAVRTSNDRIIQSGKWDGIFQDYIVKSQTPDRNTTTDFFGGKGHWNDFTDFYAGRDKGPPVVYQPTHPSPWNTSPGGPLTEFPG